MSKYPGTEYPGETEGRFAQVLFFGAAAFVLHLHTLLGLSVLYFKTFASSWLVSGVWLLAYLVGFASASRGLSVYSTIFKNADILLSYDTEASKRGEVVEAIRDNLGSQSSLAMGAFLLLGLLCL